MAEKQSPMYKKPTDAQRKKIENARKLTSRGMEEQKDFLSKISTTMAKGARDEEKMGKEMMRRIPEPVKRYESEEGAPPMGPYKKGGSVMKYEKGGMTALKKHASMPASEAHKGLKSGGMTCGPKKMMGGGMTYKKGGKIDGCAKKGKTKGKMR